MGKNTELSQLDKFKAVRDALPKDTDIELKGPIRSVLYFANKLWHSIDGQTGKKDFAYYTKKINAELDKPVDEGKNADNVRDKDRIKLKLNEQISLLEKFMNAVDEEQAFQRNSYCNVKSSIILMMNYMDEVVPSKDSEEECATTIINSENDNYNYRFLTKKYCC